MMFSVTARSQSRKLCTPWSLFTVSLLLDVRASRSSRRDRPGAAMRRTVRRSDSVTRRGRGSTVLEQARKVTAKGRGRLAVMKAMATADPEFPKKRRDALLALGVIRITLKSRKSVQEVFSGKHRFSLVQLNVLKMSRCFQDVWDQW